MSSNVQSVARRGSIPHWLYGPLPVRQVPARSIEVHGGVTEDVVVAVSNAAFAPSPSGSIPTLTRLHFPDEEGARRAAADDSLYLASHPQRSGDDIRVTFWLQSIRSVGVEGRDVLVRSELRGDTFR